MIKMVITGAFVSKGFDDNPAIRFFDGANNSQVVSFRIGEKVYDSKADNNHRWLNFTAKGFGDICERVKKMKLKEGSCINLVARYDVETWPDKITGEERSAPVLILDEIEYSGGGGQKKGQSTSDGNGATAPAAGTSGARQEQSFAPQQGQSYPPMPQGQSYPPPPQGMGPQGAPPMPENFMGFEGFSAPQGQFF